MTDSETPQTFVVRGGTVVEADWVGEADLVVAHGRVAAVLSPSDVLPDWAAGAHVVDATGMLVMPGGVDPHCHVGFTSGEFTSLDDYRQCTTAAVMGGTTTIVDFAIPRPGEAPLETAHRQRAKASDGLCDSALHGSVVDWDDTTADQLRRLCAEGIRTVKMFTTYRGESMASADTILRTMQVLAAEGGMVVIHCESNPIIEEDQRRAAAADRIDAAHMHDTRSELAETAAVAEVLSLAETLDAPVYFVHQSTPEAIELVAAARRRGARAHTESVAHHLVLDDSAYAGPHPERFVCCPPLRDRETVDAMATYLASGEVTTIGSDHCCYDTGQKLAHLHDVRAMPNGLPGVETRLPVVFSEHVVRRGLDPRRFVALTAANPAKVNGIYPQKGTLRPGSDADIAIWDPSATWTVTTEALHMATDYTPYEGLPVTGRPMSVFVRGHEVVRDGILVDDTARGRHVPAGELDHTV